MTTTSRLQPDAMVNGKKKGKGGGKQLGPAVPGKKEKEKVKGRG